MNLERNKKQWMNDREKRIKYLKTKEGRKEKVAEGQRAY